MPDERTLKKPIHPALVALIGFGAGVLLTSAWFIEKRLDGATAQTSDSDRGTATTAPETQTLIAVHDQRAGSSVFIDSVSVSTPDVWVAIVDVTASGLGNVLGAARALDPSESTEVHLLRATAPGRTYAVVLYRDNGDGVFSPSTDSVYVDFASGQRIVALFKTLL